MTSVLNWGVQVILWLQRFSPTLDLPFKGLTYLGQEEFLLLLLPVLYWCMDHRVGARLIVLFLISASVNALFKVALNQPRPFEYHPAVRQLFQATGAGFPSGHTQGAVVIWGYLAHQYRRPWLWALAGAMIVLIPLSRMYLGLHFPTDLLGGYAIGALILIAYLRWEPKVEVWLSRKGFRWQLGLALLTPPALALLFYADRRAGVAVPALLLGIGVGFAIERKAVCFACPGTWQQQILRIALGLAGMLALRFGLKAVFAAWKPAEFFDFVRYALIGLWGALGAPWLFGRLRLARTS